MTKTKFTKDWRDFYAKPLPRDDQPLREQITFKHGVRQLGDQPPKKPTVPFTGDLREAVLAGAAAVGSDGKGQGGLLGYLDKVAREHPGTELAQQARDIKRRLAVQTKEGHSHVRE